MRMLNTCYRYLTFVCLLGTSLLANVAPTDRAELYYGIAEGNYLVGNLEGAANSIEQILRFNPDYVPAITLSARVLLDQGHTAKALAAAEKAIELEPMNLEHKLLKALVLQKMGKSSEAITLIQRVVEQAPTDSDDFSAANKLLGLLQMAGGNWDAAAKSFNTIYLADPEHAVGTLKLSSEAYLEKARIALERAENNEAIQAIDQAISVYDDKTGQEALRERTQLKLVRARLLAQLGLFDQAIEDLQELLGKQPENLEIIVTLASVYSGAERWESLDSLIPSIAQIPELEDIKLYFEGRSAYSKGRVGSARAKFEEAIDLDRETRLTPSLHFYRGLCLKALKRNEEATSEIIRALNEGYRPETLHEGIIASETLMHAKQAERAIPILEALTLNEIADNTRTWALLGRAHTIEEAPALAISAYNEAIKLSPHAPEIRASRGSLLREIGDLEGALSDYSVALELSPGNSGYTYALGLTYFQVGQIDQAAIHIGAAAKALPTNAGIQLLHALLAYTIEQPEIAEKALKQYFSVTPGKPNETALYLEYTLLLQSDLGLAILALNQRLTSDQRSDFLKHFILYNADKIDRKTIIDHAGIATTPKIAQRQICEAAFWIAQHERATGDEQAYQELLELIQSIGNPDISEYQLALWQLRKRSSTESP